MSKIVEKEEANEDNNIIDIGKQDISNTLEKKKNIIKTTVADDANKEEFEMFMHLAKTYQLDPFQKEIFFWKNKGKSNIMTSRDGYLKIANRNPQYDGMDSGAFYPGDKVVRKKDGIEHEMDISNINKKPLGAYAVVYRKDRNQPTIMVVSFQEYNKPGHQAWQQYPSAMIIKVAESMCLKRAFSVSGLVSKEEVEGQSEPINAPQQTMGSTKQQNTTSNGQKQGKMTFEQAKGVMIPGGDKYEDKPAGEVKDWRLEWVAENWSDEKVKTAAKIVLDNRDNDNFKKRELTEREKEMKDLIEGDNDLRKEMLSYLNEYNTKKLDDLDDETYGDLKTYISTIKNGPEENSVDDEELAKNIAEELENEEDLDDFDTPF